MVLGSNCLPVYDFEKLVDVSIHDAISECDKFPTISGAISYDYPISVQVYRLVYHQGIHFSRLTNNLMYLMQCQMEGARINEIPNILAEDPDEKTHSIIVD